MKRAFLTALAVVLVALGGIAAAVADPGNGNGPPASVPGSPGDDCSHGNSDKPCKPDPQPEHGQECDDHGVARGNEDHCLPDTTPTDTTPTDTTPTDTTPTDTTPTDTTPTTPEVTTPTPTPTTTEPAPTQPTTPTPQPKPKPKPKPKVTKAAKTKVVKVTPKPDGVVVITTADGKKHVGVMGSG